MSKKREREMAIYAEKRVRFLGKFDECQIGPLLRAAGVEVQCEFSATQVHHRCRRIGKNYLDEATWIATCFPCHHYVETHAGKARELGLLQ